MSNPYILAMSCFAASAVITAALMVPFGEETSPAPATPPTPIVRPTTFMSGANGSSPTLTTVEHDGHRFVVASTYQGVAIVEIHDTQTPEKSQP